jgi:serine/threonine protein kinase
VSDERSGSASDVTQRDFVGGQRLFGRYTLIKILGRGGMGIVWLAHDEELERDVALKFLPDLIIHDAAVLSDLKRETRRSLELTHKNIVRIYDFVHDERSACISMEYIDGETLSNLRAEKVGGNGCSVSGERSREATAIGRGGWATAATCFTAD